VGYPENSGPICPLFRSSSKVGRSTSCWEAHGKDYCFTLRICAHLKTSGFSWGINHYWLVVWNMAFMTFHILGISSSQLTFIFFRGVAQPPTRLDHMISNGNFLENGPSKGFSWDLRLWRTTPTTSWLLVVVRAPRCDLHEILERVQPVKTLGWTNPLTNIWGFQKWRYPKLAGWFIKENRIKLDDLGVRLF